MTAVAVNLPTLRLMLREAFKKGAFWNFARIGERLFGSVGSYVSMEGFRSEGVSPPPPPDL